jgi:hypothetical protein
MKMTRAFRLGYKLGRLHGKTQLANQVTQVWNGYVANLNEANERAANHLEELHNESVAGLDAALTESGVSINDLDQANLEPADRKTRRKMKRAEKAWNREQAEASIPLP